MTPFAPTPEPEDWRLRAACRGLATALFIPTTGPPPPEARAACQRCPVTAECDADRNGDEGLRAGVYVGSDRWLRRNTCRHCGGSFTAIGGQYRTCAACSRARAS